MGAIFAWFALRGVARVWVILGIVVVLLAVWGGYTGVVYWKGYNHGYAKAEGKYKPQVEGLITKVNATEALRAAAVADGARLADALNESNTALGNLKNASEVKIKAALAERDAAKAKAGRYARRITELQAIVDAQPSTADVCAQAPAAFGILQELAKERSP